MPGEAAEIYLDHSATTPPRREVLEALAAACEAHYGNPSSLHRKGVEAERHLRRARQQVAAALAVRRGRIVFTSGGTEANNLALLGAGRALGAAPEGRPWRVVVSRIEHPSVLRAAERLAAEGFVLDQLGVDERGIVSPDELDALVRDETVLVSLMAVNNEVGSVQPIREVAARLRQRARRRRILFHVDAVQAFGKLVLRPEEWGIDLLTVSGHKIHGLKGAGALYAGAGVRLEPMLYGGGQEAGLRSGTENVPGIVALGAAAELAEAEREEAAPRLRELKLALWRGLRQVVPELECNGPPPESADSAPHILNVSWPGLRGEILVHALEEQGVYASTSSACSSRDTEPSHVLLAMGRPGPVVEGAVRFSLSPLTTSGEIERAIAAFRRVAGQLRPVAALAGRRR